MSLSMTADSVSLLIRLKEAVDIMRDVRPGDEASKAKIQQAMATIESVMTELRRQGKL